MLATRSEYLQNLLMQEGIHRTFQEGEVILREDTYISSIPLVVSGSIKVLRTDETGREILLYYIYAGESCIMSFLGGLHDETSKVKAVAEEETEILFVPMARVTHLIRENAEWLDFIFRLYHKRFEELLEVINAVAFKKLDERLLDLLEKKRKLTGSGVLQVTHEQLANELGTARVVISRLLNQLADEGRVKLGRNKITLL